MSVNNSSMDPRLAPPKNLVAQSDQTQTATSASSVSQPTTAEASQPVV